MREIRSIFTYFFTIVAILIVLLIPMPILEEYRLFGIAVLLFAFVGFILSDFSKTLKDQELEQQKLSERLKIYERLSKIEAQIEVMNNG